jgi:hypothetical protein
VCENNIETAPLALQSSDSFLTPFDQEYDPPAASEMKVIAERWNSKSGQGSGAPFFAKKIILFQMFKSNFNWLGIILLELSNVLNFKSREERWNFNPLAKSNIWAKSERRP